MWLPWHTLVASASLAHSAYAVHTKLMTHPYYAQLARLLCTRDSVLLRALTEFFFHVNGEDARTNIVITSSESSEGEEEEEEEEEEEGEEGEGGEVLVRRRTQKKSSTTPPPPERTHSSPICAVA